RPFFFSLFLLGAWSFLFPPSRINRENLDRIKKGMTEREVEKILGPYGRYSTGILVADLPPEHSKSEAAIEFQFRAIKLESVRTSWIFSKSNPGCLVSPDSVGAVTLPR